MHEKHRRVVAWYVSFSLTSFEVRGVFRSGLATTLLYGIVVSFLLRRERLELRERDGTAPRVGMVGVVET
jgi:hypothetical protein